MTGEEPLRTSTRTHFRASRRGMVRRGERRIDLGGIAKGFAVDAAIDVLQQHGVDSALVNAGGDLRCFGSPRDIRVRNPAEPGEIVLSIRLNNMALASSATGALVVPASATASALLDPKSRRPLPGGGGATVAAPSCMLADGLTKVVLVTGDPDQAALGQRDAYTVLHRGGAQR